MFSFEGLKKATAEAEPVVIELDNVELEEASGTLVMVEDIKEEDLEPEVKASVESFQEDVRPSISLAPNNNTLGLDLSKAEFKPAPMILGENGTTYVYLIGACDSTVDPLIHMLLGGSPEDSVVIEICIPYLAPGTLLSIAAAIQQTDAQVVVNCAYTANTFEALVALSVKTPSINDGFFTFAPLKYWTKGTSMEQQTQSAMYKKYCEEVFAFLKNKNVLTEEEIVKITEKDTEIVLKSDEIRNRLGM